MLAAGTKVAAESPKIARENPGNRSGSRPQKHQEALQWAKLDIRVWTNARLANPANRFKHRHSHRATHAAVGAAA